jgi:glycine cleavage system aminomethyltransferase T
LPSETFTFYVQPWYRKSPYFDATKRHGCTSWGLYNHMLLPTLYDDPITEYWALVNDVTLWDVAVERCIEVRGRDAFELIDSITCRDLSRVEVMQARYVLITAPWGGIVNDPVLLRLAEDRFWLALADSDALLYLAGVAGARGLDVEIFEADVAPMQIQGPRSKDVVRDLLGDAVADIRYYFCAEADVDGIPVVVSRTGWTGEVGFELYLQDTRRGDDLFERIVRAGEPHGIRVIAPSEARRIEAGIFNYGSDIRIEDTPLHVTGLEKFVEWNKDRTFLGRERLEQIRDGSLLERKLVGIEIGSEPMTDEGALNDFWPLVEGDATVGRITAGAWSPRLEKNIGYGWVPIHRQEPGSELEAHTPRGRVPVTVAPLPFVDPNKDVPKS